MINLLTISLTIMKHARQFLLMAAVLLCSVSVSAQTYWDGTADKSWAGSGTAADPYLITSAEELAGLAEQVNDKSNKRDFAGEYFKLTQDLYLTDFTQPDTTSWLEWIPIGRWTDEQDGPYIHHMDTCYFRGHFDGGNHTIYNVYMGTVGEIDMGDADDPLAGDIIDLSGSSVGFFGFVDGGSISNLSLQNAGIACAFYYNGGLISNASNATISNCHLRKSTVIVPKTSSVGGLIGRLTNCVVDNCSVEDMYVRGAYVAGLVCLVDGTSVIRNSHAEGVAYIINRHETGNYGGFGGGLVYGNGGLIENCYANMEIHGNYATEFSGGFVAQNDEGGVIRNCYATGDVYQPYNSAAGFVARNFGLIESCYSTGNVIVEDDTNYNSARVFVSQQGYYEFYYEVVADVPGTTINCFCTGAVLTTDSGEQPIARGFGGSNGATNNRFVNCSFNRDNVALLAGFGTSISSYGARGYTTAYMQSREFVDDLNMVAALYGISKWEYRAGQYPVPTGVKATNLRDYLGGGSGTEEDPFLVTTKKHLENFRDYVHFGETFQGMHIRQTADIALNLPRDKWGIQMPETWTPIGTPITSQLHTVQGNWEQRYFRGTYDGDFHKVENMYIDDPVGLPAGLFGALHHGAVIKNLSVTDAYVLSTGDVGNVGILAGETSRYANNVYISQCHTSGLVGDPDNSLGLWSAAAIIGHIGLEGDPYILNCSSDAEVYGTDASAVTRQTGIGGADTIANFLFTGTLHADGVSRPFKGIPMSQDPFVVTENGYFDSDVYKWSDSEANNWNDLGRSTQYLQSREFVNVLNAYVADWNQTHAFKLDLWQWREGDYPCVKPNYQPALTVTYETSGGTAIAPRRVERNSRIQPPKQPTREGYIFAGWYADAMYTKVFEFESTAVTQSMTLYAKWLEPTYDEYDYSIFNNKFATEFHITNKAQFIGFVHAVNGIDGVLTANNFKGKTVYLDCDILLNDTADWKYWGDLVYAEPWTPIGTGSKYCDPINPFLGTFDGQGHVISGLYVDGEAKSGYEWQGLFGFVGAKGEATIIRNLGIQASAVNMRGRTSEVTAGLFVGLLRGGTISQCFAKGKIVANPDRGDDDTGGFAGCLGGYYTNTSGGAITDCYAQVDFQYVPMDINAKNRGLIGAGMVDYNSGTVSNSYVVGSGWEEGASGGKLSNTYYNKSLNANALANSGTGLTNNEMHSKACYVGFDFDTIWGRSDSINNGYPYLRCFYEKIIPDSPDPVRVTGISFAESGKTLNVVMCDSLQLHAKVLPEEASEQQIVWTFEKLDAYYESYLSIDSCGLVTTSYDKREKQTATFVVTASTYEGNYEKRCTLKVHQPRIDIRWPNKCRRIGTTEWSEAVSSGVIGWEYLYAYSITPDSLHQPLTISVTDPELASVEIISQDTIVPKGFISGTTEPVRCVLFAVSMLKEGWVKTTALHPKGYTQSNEYSSLTTARFVEATGIGIEAAKTTLAVGETLQLQMSTEPVMTSVLPEATWSSSDESILKVDANGMVTAVGAGTASITLTTSNPEFSAAKEITVEHISPTGIEILSSVTERILVEGDTCTLYAKFTPENTSMREVDWALSDASDSEYVKLLPMGDSCKVVVLKGGHRSIITATSVANGCYGSYGIAAMSEGQADLTELFFVNTDFETGTTTGWTTSKPSNATNFGPQNTAADHGYQGTYFMEAWRRGSSILGNFEWSQTQAVPNGTYRVSALAHAKYERDASVIPQGVYVFAEDQQVEVTTTTASEYTVIVEVTDGTLTIGYRGVGCNVNWAASDNFRIISADSEFTVTFYDWDGTVLKTETVKWGESATAPANPERLGYTFMGWDKAFTNVQSNLIVNAIYEQIEYTVTFCDWNGMVLKSETVKWGQDATAPADPTREGYTFTGWDKAFANIQSALTVNAVYEQNEYTVTFYDWDGTVLKTETVKWGQTATAPANPTREGYTFTGWDKAFTNVKSDLSVRAVYIEIGVPEYIVTFCDWDGTVLKRQTVVNGQDAVAPADPTREGYTFTGWDKAFTNVQSDLTINAIYVQNEYTVTFCDWNGIVLKTETVKWGQDATAPTDPVREDYTFTGWDKEFTNVQSDLVVNAVYIQNRVEPDPGTSELTYTTQFNAGTNGWIDGTVWHNQTEKIAVYTSPLYRAQGGKVTKLRITVNRTKGNTKYFCLSELELYDANGNKIALSASNVTSNADHNALNAIPDGGGFVALFDGQTSTYFHSAWQNMPSGDHYLEVTLPNGGYDAFSFKMLSRARTIENGKVYDQSHTFPGVMTMATAVALVVGDAPEPEPEPTPEPDPTPELDNETLYHVTQPHNGGTSWAIAKGGSVMTVNTKLGIAASSTDARQLFMFTSNDGGKTRYLYHPAEKKYVNKDNTLSATPKDPVYFEEGMYENTFVVYFDSEHVINTNSADGLIINRWGPFSGWGKADSGNSCAITAVEVTPEPEPTYTVTFYDWNNTVLKTQTVKKGESATAPANPTRSGYTFTGWDKAFTNVQSDLSVRACYTQNAEPEPDPQPELDSETLYYVSQPHHEKGATSWAVAQGGSRLQTNVELGIAADGKDSRQQFAFISNDGGKTYYLYHPAERKYISKDGTLNATSKDAVYFKKGAYSNTFVVYFDNAHFINVDQYRMVVVNDWGPGGRIGVADGGNSCRFTAMGKFDMSDSAIDAVTADEAQRVRKVIEHGELFIILPDGSKYTVTGIRVE